MPFFRFHSSFHFLRPAAASQRACHAKQRRHAGFRHAAALRRLSAPPRAARAAPIPSPADENAAETPESRRRCCRFIFRQSPSPHESSLIFFEYFIFRYYGDD
jgi:hypothetical protein